MQARHRLACTFGDAHTEPMTRTRQFHDPTAGIAGAAGRIDAAVCAHPTCTLAGEYRAPKSPDDLENFHWFCLEHVREYNASWNYYAGMTDGAIEAAIREDVVWRRPTWPLGLRPGAIRFEDPFGLFNRDDTQDAKTAREGRAQMQNMTGEERRAMATLGLEAPVSLADVKLRYKVLAKTLHPDANGGDKRAEERLKSVNHAYTTLRDSDRLV